jgi:hypothetical protein
LTRGAGLPSLDALKLDGAKDFPHEVREIEMAMKIGSDGGETVPDMSFASGHGLLQLEECISEKSTCIIPDGRRP